MLRVCIVDALRILLLRMSARLARHMLLQLDRIDVHRRLQLAAYRTAGQISKNYQHQQRVNRMHHDPRFSDRPLLCVHVLLPR
ncbi:hypothetical protein SAMN05216317_12221 [Nitrosomonas eutropha]|nr:hypothetical protein SAMN05216317_12221 [Nitrosomonas eutropha]SEJ21740.1 hypothetical protein SAMN05216318_13221 [Nitrosomonas eutropha]